MERGNGEKRENRARETERQSLISTDDTRIWTFGNFDLCE